MSKRKGKGKTQRKDSLYQRFMGLPKNVQRELDRLYMQQSRIVDEKWRAAEKYILPVVMNQFLAEYNKVRDKEITLERNITSFGERHSFTLKELLELRVQLVKGRYDSYLKKRGIENPKIITSE